MEKPVHQRWLHTSCCSMEHFAKSNNRLNLLKSRFKWGSKFRPMLSTVIWLLSLCEGVKTAVFSGLFWGFFCFFFLIFADCLETSQVGWEVLCSGSCFCSSLTCIQPVFLPPFSILFFFNSYISKERNKVDIGLTGFQAALTSPIFTLDPSFVFVSHFFTQWDT